ncbi:ORF020 [Spodoptera frugiperda granulovirus]|uniref:ORF020 n=1 Tax=Spodoptera frugiperda granulovirus TaxID=307454 RepID=A0A0C5AQ52_9BBAC|nr:ORF020 [Spodoptera frugiperda granulovirus]AJK91681.1 ORF020 [Spodoptera frugiperda granulovirus]AXS01039.1 ORF020 [Spodoptera frugiperda granulovirus]
MLGDVLVVNRIKKSIVVVAFDGNTLSIYQGSNKYIARKKNKLYKLGTYSVMYECYVKQKSDYIRHLISIISDHCINLSTSKSGPYQVLDDCVLIELHHMFRLTSHCIHKR